MLATSLTPGLFERLGSDSNLSDILGMHYWQSSKFNPVQLVTYMFMHGGWMHIFFNMFALYMFGGVLESFWGPKRFLLYYMVTGIGAGIIQQIFWTIEFTPMLNEINQQIASNFHNAPMLIQQKKLFLDNPNFVTVGASGAVFGLLLAFGWLFPEQRLFVFPIPFPIKARIFVLIYGVAELSLGVAQFSGDKIAQFAHLGGMLFGANLIIYWKRKNIL